MVFAEGVKLIYAHTSRSSSLDEDVLTVAEQAGHPQRVRRMDLVPKAQRVDRQQPVVLGESNSTELTFS